MGNEAWVVQAKREARAAKDATGTPCVKAERIILLENLVVNALSALGDNDQQLAKKILNAAFEGEGND